MAEPAPPIPAPRLRQLRNGTPFPHFQFDKMGKGRRFHDVVVVCASFVLAPGRLEPAAFHRGPVFADESWDAAHATLSSLRMATDVLLLKPDADVYVTGTAHALDWTPRRDWRAELQVHRHHDAPLLHKALRLTGPRHWDWQPDAAQRSLSDAQPTLAVPLRYELAYGGWGFDQGDDESAPPRTHSANPCGTGWFGSAAREDHPGARHAAGQPFPGPQIEHTDAPLQHANHKDAQPVGFGPVARFWQPRVALAGTYDDAWRERHAGQPYMDYADDFDERFFQYAPADQVVAGGLRGDESLRMSGFFASTPCTETQLPHLWIEALCRNGDGIERSEAMKLDTVHIDLDEMLVHLTWRLTLDQALDTVAVDLFERPITEAIAADGAARQGIPA
ncbi:hypothetical protein SAMN05518854_11238 [Variovorax sp. YR266]|uniref:DUF2169 family type VI secretion system accessory protein n=1 Tax=Variovorax sp. YR266 TaxID=1884386 RepID=UPI000897C016|nr:DUF2169 domain-containing protein [Variovorax sp. YR266]SDZ69384.1 hypothetical protein SAMN05518854_11238 [Variovorax sp. YR266]